MDPPTTDVLSLNALFEAAEDGVFVLDADRRFVLFNRACERLTGRSANEIVGSSCECLDTEGCADHRGRSLVEMLCPGLAVIQGHLPARPHRVQVESRNGQSRWLETHYVALHNADGRPQCIIGVMRDGSATTEAAAEVAPLDERLAEIERRAILAAIRQAGGRRNLAARLMGISRSRLYRRLEALGINLDGDSSSAEPPTDGQARASSDQPQMANE